MRSVADDLREELQEEALLLSFEERMALALRLGVTGLVKRATYKDWNGSDWRYGMGLQIVDSNAIQLWGTASDPSGSQNNYSINLYRYS